ncbi:glycosyltransferase family 2 protein, partial [Rhodopirellula sp.]|nr:glycosyltransferase family 2 protein [Rhodopirellula sp.]
MGTEGATAHGGVLNNCCTRTQLTTFSSKHNVMNISVNICTWNRASELRKTLQSMTLLEIPEGINWELLIVNNNCTDETDDVVHQYLQKLPIVYLHEHTPGKSHALNLALKHATGELILFTDDDVLVSQAWLKHYAITAADFPNHSVFGGCVTPLYEKKPPTWIEENIEDLRDVFALRPVDQPTHECNDEIPFV